MKVYWPYKLFNYIAKPFYRRVFLLEGHWITYNYFWYPEYKVHEFRYDYNIRTFNAEMTNYELALRRLQIELYDAPNTIH